MRPSIALPLIAALVFSAGQSLAFQPAQETAPTEPEAAVEEAPPTWEEISAEFAKDDRFVISGQPDPEDLRAFAEAGGKIVINNRTQREVDRLNYREQELIEELGLTYIHIPVSSTTFSQEDAQALAEAYASTEGPILMHCGSGGRSKMLYSLYLTTECDMPKEEAIAKAIDMGLSESSSRYVERELWEVPDRVMEAVDPLNLRLYVDTLAGFGTRHTLSDTESDTRGIGAARRWVKTQFEANIEGHGKEGDAAPRVYFDSHTVQPDRRRIPREVEVVNVICEIPSSNSDTRDRLFYVLAHLDSRASGALDAESDSPGANDDASGVALMIELARVLSKEQLDGTIVLMATSGEEQGLFGARLHAQAAKDAGKNIVAVLNNDTVGDPTGVLEGQDGSKEIRVFSEGLPATMIDIDESELSNAVRWKRLYGTESDSPSRQLARFIEDVAYVHRTTIQPRLIFRPDRFLRGGDHTPFNELGFSAIRFCETYENYDHQHQDVRVEDGVQYGDLPEFVDENYLADVTRLNAVTLLHLTTAPSAPENARMLVAELTNDTTLRWDPSPEDSVAGYEIVWRDTTSSQWEEFQDVGNVTEGTVPLSKDNWFFGVRSYDKDGFRSMVSYPRPARE